MAFTLVTVTGSYRSQVGEPATGQLIFTLTQPIQNADVIVNPGPIVVTLDETGSFSAQLYATDDPGTVPQGAWYGVTEQVSVAQPRDYFITVSSATSPVDISTLMPAQGRWT